MNSVQPAEVQDGHLGLQYAGQEYEALLSEKLRCAGIAFFSEDKLREEGFFKTPDVKLEVQSRPCIPAVSRM